MCKILCPSDLPHLLYSIRNRSRSSTSKIKLNASSQAKRQMLLMFLPSRVTCRSAVDGTLYNRLIIILYIILYYCRLYNIYYIIIDYIISRGQKESA